MTRDASDAEIWSGLRRRFSAGERLIRRPERWCDEHPTQMKMARRPTRLRAAGAGSLVGGAAVVILVAVALGLGYERRPSALAPTAASSITLGSPVVRTALQTGNPETSVASRGSAIAPTPDPSATSGTFIATGTMLTNDNSDSATLLSDGRVLILGDAATSPEVYDPKTGKFSATGSMTTSRRGGTATRLTDGRVLVVGGMDVVGGVNTDTDKALATAELYDPTTGTFSRTGSMRAARVEGTATLLPDGRLLLAGGFESSARALATAELYDPATGEFSSTGSMAVPRASFTATMLATGRVLVAGGDEGGVGATAELYDPTTGKFSRTGSLTVARHFQTATLLKDGRVLIVGGTNSQYGVNSPELYNPATGKFSATGAMSTDRMLHSSTLLSDGRVLVAGGQETATSSALGFTLASCELYDPATGTFTPTGSLIEARNEQTATLLTDGRVLISGGGDISGWLASAELYRP